MSERERHEINTQVNIILKALHAMKERVGFRGERQVVYLILGEINGDAISVET